MLTFSDTEEKAVEKAIAALADMIPLEAIQPPHSPALTFPGLEIRLHQRRVLKDGTDIYLTRKVNFKNGREQSPPICIYYRPILILLPSAPFICVSGEKLS